MSEAQPNPEARLYGLRYILSFLLQARQLGTPRDLDLEDQLAFLTLLSRRTGLYKSQLGQDLFALAMSGDRQGGYFVEVGAHHGEQLSNTWLLETEHGWTGLLVEPNPQHEESLRQRRATLVRKAAWKRTGATLTFHATRDSALSSLAGSAPKDQHDRSDFQEITVETMTLDDILIQQGAPRQIDFISIDVEGAELDVLDGLSFDKWDVQAMCLEHNHDKDRLAEFDRRLASVGLRRVFDTVSDFDAFYARAECLERWRKTAAHLPA
ncbi:MAG: FkbM family methyltransferase [Hyphomicrobiaceae bacterium]